VARGTWPAYGALAVLALFWGYSWIALKIATRDASPILVAAIRPVLGAVALLGVMAALRRPLRPPPTGPTIVYGLLQTTGFNVCQTVAVSLAGAGKVASSPTRCRSGSRSSPGPSSASASPGCGAWRWRSRPWG
jgi:drug/metabolite transporter (DMT)-like permease